MDPAQQHTVKDAAMTSQYTSRQRQQVGPAKELSVSPRKFMLAGSKPSVLATSLEARNALDM